MRLHKPILVFIFLSICLCASALRVNIPYGPADASSDERKTFSIDFMLDTGFGVTGINDGLGVTDYQVFFIRTGFSIWQFSMALEFNIRFRIFTMEPEFKTNDWAVRDNPAATAFAWIDKIRYLRFGSDTYPIYAATGELPWQTFGTGLLVKHFNNTSFVPIDRENGFIMRFNGNHLTEWGSRAIPVTASFSIPDLCDPDIFLMNADADVLRFFHKIKRNFRFNIGTALAMDFNATEANRLSSTDRNYFTSYRNIQTDGYTTSVIGLSIPVTFSWSFRRIFRFIWKDELAFLWKSGLNDDKTINTDTATFSLANLAEVEGRFVWLENSGYLLGVNLGFIVTTNDFNVSNFGSNYQIVRKKQFDNTNNDLSFIILVGLGFYGFHDNISFSARAYFDMNHIHIDETNSVGSYAVAKLEATFTMSDVVVKGLSMDFSFVTAMSHLEAKDSNGGYFIRSVTRDCRLYFGICYQIYSAKIRMMIGLQSPAWNNDSEYIDPSNEQYNYDVDKYGADLQKFVGVEVSFVL
ncbi:MAG: hypothetical protein IKQ61_08510 [Spirochaetales bacterium]|nr:hypothetical protein [Spirochaetales bacterium]